MDEELNKLLDDIENVSHNIAIEEESNSMNNLPQWAIDAFNGKQDDNGKMVIQGSKNSLKYLLEIVENENKTESQKLIDLI